jgi:hypothetical protein
VHRGVLLGLHLGDHLRVRLSKGLSPVLRRVEHVLEVLTVRLAAVARRDALAHGGVVPLLHFNSARDPLLVAGKGGHSVVMMHELDLPLPDGRNHVEGLPLLSLVDACQVLRHLRLRVIN